MNTPRELYLAACTEIAESLSPLGFKFARSGPRAQRTDGEFTYRVSFQSSHKNISGHYVALWIHATVSSKRLGEWRASQAHTLGVSDGVAGGQIGNLLQAYGWRDWNLAVPTRPAVIADAISAVYSIALPYFAKFADLRSLCALLQREELPAMRSTEAIEFLLCFADRSAADAALRSFFHRRSDLLADYCTHLQQFREGGLPQRQMRRTGFAYELAFATVAYGLTPPDAAQQGAPPNGGPAALVGNSGVMQGPPSVS